MKTELSPEDRDRIEQEAFKRYPDGEDIDLNWHYRTVFVSSAEYATIYEREKLEKFKQEIESVKGLWSCQQILDCLKRFQL